MRVSKYVVRWKKMSQKKKIGIVTAGVLAVIGMGFVGVKAYPHVQSFVIRQKYEYIPTKAEKEEMETLMKELEKPKSKEERMELYEKTKVLRESVAQLTPERKEDQEYYRMYLENGEQLKTDDSGELFYQYQQDSRNLYDMVYQEVASLKDNFESIATEYDQLKKEHEGTKLWNTFDAVYQEVKTFVEEKQLDVTKKEQLETKMLDSYLKLYEQ